MGALTEQQLVESPSPPNVFQIDPPVIAGARTGLPSEPHHEVRVRSEIEPIGDFFHGHEAGFQALLGEIESAPIPIFASGQAEFREEKLIEPHEAQAGLALYLLGREWTIQGSLIQATGGKKGAMIARGKTRNARPIGGAEREPCGQPIKK